MTNNKYNKLWRILDGSGVEKKLDKTNKTKIERKEENESRSILLKKNTINIGMQLMFDFSHWKQFYCLLTIRFAIKLPFIHLSSGKKSKPKTKKCNEKKNLMLFTLH